METREARAAASAPFAAGKRELVGRIWEDAWLEANSASSAPTTLLSPPGNRRTEALAVGAWSCIWTQLTQVPPGHMLRPLPGSPGGITVSRRIIRFENPDRGVLSCGMIPPREFRVKGTLPHPTPLPTPWSGAVGTTGRDGWSRLES